MFSQMSSTNIDYLEYNHPMKYIKFNKDEKPSKTITMMMKKKMDRQIRKKHTSNITRKVSDYYF